MREGGEQDEGRRREDGEGGGWEERDSFKSYQLLIFITEQLIFGWNPSSACQSVI